MKSVTELIASLIVVFSESVIVSVTLELPRKSTMSSIEESIKLIPGAISLEALCSCERLPLSELWRENTNR